MANISIQTTKTAMPRCYCYNPRSPIMTVG